MQATAEREDYEALYEDAPCGYVTMERDGTVLRANRTFLAWTGAGPQDCGSRLTLRDVLTRAAWAVFSMKCLPVLTMQGKVQEIALELRRADGLPLSVLASFQRLDRPGGLPPLFRATLFDATERRLYERDLLAARRAAEEARHAAERAGAQLGAVLESTTDSVLLVDPDWRIAYANPHAARMHRRSPIGRDIRTALPSDDEGLIRQACERAMAGEEVEPVEATVACTACLRLHARPASGGGIAVFFRDVTREKAAERDRISQRERIEHMARHDPLTGLPNRTEFAARLREAFAMAGGQVAVLCLDLDRFKQVNDSLGHPVGDELLQAVAGRLKALLRPQDTVARFGGDEFAVVLASATRGRGAPDMRHAAESAASRIVQALGAPFQLGRHHVEIGASVGVALRGTGQAEPGELMAEADFALYHAKREGRGRHAVFEPGMMAGQRARLATAAALRRGLEAGELVPHYQPIVDVASRAVLGYEALARWRRPGHGLVQPAEFIAIAEETGLIGPLDTFMLRRACRDAAAWGDATWRVAVNVSPAQFRAPDFLAIVQDALRAGGLDPRRLELEITEGLLLERTEQSLATLQRLREMGVAVAMDDFGTGYSSLAYLRLFPFDRVKIDRAFVRELETSADDCAIVEAITTLCRRLRMRCTAEGIETEGQLALLARLGCTEAQGFLFDTPAPTAGERGGAACVGHDAGDADARAGVPDGDVSCMTPGGGFG